MDKKIGSTASVNEEPACKLHKPVIKEFKRRRVYARFEENIWAAGLVEIGSLTCKNQRVKYTFTKCAWVKPLIDKKG